MARNKNLQEAKRQKNDEFYTQISDIENELKHYKHHFKNKVVFCNCDDPEYSEFYNYFHLNFEEFELKKLICTHYDREKPTYKLEIEKDINGDGRIDDLDVIKTPLMQNGDFRSDECIELLKEADIVVGNPPFSLYRQYVAQLIEYNKKFVIIGNMNSVTYKEIFPLLKDNKMWAGYSFNKTMTFAVPDNYDTTKSVGIDNYGRKLVKVPAICWFTNLDIPKRHEPLILWQRYYDDNGNPLSEIEEKYPHYDNYNAINVDKVKDIPVDYVPCWFECPKASECDWAKAGGLDNSVTAPCDNNSSIHPSTLPQSSEYQYHTSTDIAQNSSELSELSITEAMENGTCASAKSEGKKNINESQFKGCNGLIGVPISYLGQIDA